MGLKVDDPDVDNGFYCEKCKPGFLNNLADKRRKREMRDQAKAVEKATRKRLRQEVAAQAVVAAKARAADAAAAAAAASASGGGHSFAVARDAGASGAAAAASTSSSSAGDALNTKAKSSNASVKNAQVGLLHQLLQLF